MQAVTIVDILGVINSGRMKQKSYEPYTAVSTLMAAWVSKASEKQRRGRAGRCQPVRALGHERSLSLPPSLSLSLSLSLSPSLSVCVCVGGAVCVCVWCVCV